MSLLRRVSVLAIIAWTVLLTGVMAAAQPITWKGPAVGGYNESFSMARWMYGRMAHVSSNPRDPAWGTKPNSRGGYDITYTGEGANQIACSSEHLNSSNGLWICQISNNILTDGPLTRKPVTELLSENLPGSIQTNSGLFQIIIGPQSIQAVMKYNYEPIQSVKCDYRKSAGAILKAVCALQ